jgi:AbiTii
MRLASIWTPVQFPNAEFDSSVSEQLIYQSMKEIEELISGNDDLRCNFAPEAQALLQQLFRRETEFTCMHSRAGLASIPDEVRNRLLRWSIELDKAGIRGDGLTFSSQEKNVAHSIIVQGIMNVGVLGEVHSPANIAVGSHARAGNISAEDIQQLIASIEPHVCKASSPGTGDLAKALNELKSEAKKDRVEGGKLKSILMKFLGLAGKIGDQVTAAGIKAVVEGWMKAHGLAP